jgi:hypothetical protein
MTAGDVVTSLVDKVGLGGDSSAYTLSSFSSKGQQHLCVYVYVYLVAICSS